MATVQLIGGGFQDLEGNALANGYLIMELSGDAQTPVPSQVVSGIKVKILLDANGDVSTTPKQYVWPNDQLTPADEFYTVTGYSSKGVLAWGPQYVQVLSSPDPFNVGAWVPVSINSVSTSALVLETNGTKNNSQVLLNLKSGTNTTVTDQGSGNVKIDAATVALKTNGTLNGNQGLLNLAQGSNVTLVDNGTGTVTIAATAPTPITKYIPAPDYKLYSKWLPGAASSSNANILLSGDNLVTNASWNAVPPGASTVIVPTATTNSYWQGTNNYVSGPGTVTALFMALGEQRAWSGRNIRYAANATILQNITSQLYWLAMVGAANNTDVLDIAYTTTPTIPAIGFYSNNGGNWFCNVGNGSANTAVDSGIAGVINVPHLFEFSVNAGSNVVFKIDGNIVATISTHLPPTSALANYYSVAPAANVTGGLRFSYIYSEVDTLNT